MTDDLTPSFLRDDGGDAVEGLKPFLGFLKKTASRTPYPEYIPSIWRKNRERTLT